MSATILNTVSNSLLHPVAGMVSAYNSLYKTSKFENMSTVQPGVLAFIIILSLYLTFPKPVKVVVFLVVNLYKYFPNSFPSGIYGNT